MNRAFGNPPLTTLSNSVLSYLARTVVRSRPIKRHAPIHPYSTKSRSI